MIFQVGPTRAVIMALILALLPSLALIVTPIGQAETVETTDTGSIVVASESTTVLESEGPIVLLALAVPVALYAVPVFAAGQPRRRRIWTAVGVFATLTTTISLASIGLFYVPALIALWIAIAREPPAGAQ